MDTKQLGVVDIDLKALDPDDPAGMFEAVLSAPTLDRDGEIIDPKAFDPLPDHITIDVDHGMTVSTTVGSGVPFYDDDLLKVHGGFSTIPRAQEVRTLVAEGHIRKMSVAFMDAKRVEDEDGQVHITSAELLNAAIVPIPSNREADILAAKALAVRSAAEGGSAAQVLHDLAVADGAECRHAPASEEEIVTTPEEPAAAPAAAEPPADVTRALVELSLAEAALTLTT